jgi:hypothetical protein
MRATCNICPPVERNQDVDTAAGGTVGTLNPLWRVELLAASEFEFPASILWAHPWAVDVLYERI